MPGTLEVIEAFDKRRLFGYRLVMTQANEPAGIDTNLPAIQVAR